MKLSPQILLLVLALGLCSVWPTPELWTWLAAYGVAWLLLNYSLDSTRRVELAARPWVLAGLAVLLAAPAVAYLVRSSDTIARREGLRGLDVHLADRLRLEAKPAIFPPVVAGDRPQNLYVHAPDGHRVALRLGDGVEELPGVDLGHGLFRVDYDPRRDGSPADPVAQLQALIDVDGEVSTRTLRFVRWQPHPRWPCADAERGIAIVPSEETDEVFVVRRSDLDRSVPDDVRDDDAVPLDAVPFDARPFDASLDRIDVGDGPTGCALLADGRVAVTHRYDRSLRLVQVGAGVETHTGESLDLGPFQVAIAASADGNHLAVAQAGLRPSIHLVSTDPLAVVESIPLDARLDDHFEDGLEPDAVHFVGAGLDRLVVTSARHRAIVRLDRDSTAPSGWKHAELYLGRPAVTSVVTAAASPESSVQSSVDSASLYLAITDYRPDGVEHRGNHFLQDQLLKVDVDDWRVSRRLLTGRRSARQDHPGDIDRGVSAMGIAAYGEGDLLVAFAGSEEAWRLDEDLSRPPTVLSSQGDFDLVAPFGVADLGNGLWLATSPVGGSMAVYDRDGQLVKYLSVSPTDGELAAAPEGSLSRQDLDLRSGERAFYETTRSGISCQSCHLRGATDFAPHDIGQSLLLHTLTTRGLAGTAPYLRDGSFPRIRDLHVDLAEPLYRGFRRDLQNRPALLETYVHALVADTNPAIFEPRDLDLERQGLDAFVRARCDLCHGLPAFSHLSRHPSFDLFPELDVAPTLFLDTPSLLAVHAKEDFLHDGRAHDLDAVLDEFNQANRHGDTAALDENERRALLHLLRSL